MSPPTLFSRGSRYFLGVLFVTALATPLLLKPSQLFRQRDRRPSTNAPVIGSGEAAIKEAATRGGATPQKGWWARGEEVLGRFSEAATAFRTSFSAGLAGRGPVLAFHSRLELDLFLRSPVPEVLAGRDGWLFFTGSHSVEGFRGVHPLRNAALQRLQQKFTSRHAELARRGIAYLLVVVPDKQTVYPEAMPAAQTRVGLYRREQVVAYLRAHTEVPVLDLGDTLTAAKGRSELYHRRDTHWNEWGAFVGYQAIASALQRSFPTVRILTAEELAFSSQPCRHFDLAKILGLGPSAGELEPHLTTAEPGAEIDDGGLADNPLIRTKSPTGEIRKAVVYRDSFEEALRPFLTRHFQQAVLCHGVLPPLDLVEQEQPDVVLDILAERFLYELVWN